MTTGDGTVRPIAVYTDVEDTDVTAGVELLESAGFEVRILGSMDPEAIVEAAANATALLVGYAEITAEMVERMPTVQIISLMSMGVNNVDLGAAERHGKWVTNIGSVASEEVATHTLALILSITRGIKSYDRAVDENAWNSRSPYLQPRLSELTLGLVGLGNIGRRVVEYARPFFGTIVAYDPFFPDTEDTQGWIRECGVQLTSLEEVRTRAHVLTLHTPLTAETEHMVNEGFISQMPAGSYLVNVSRGQLIDPAAVRDAVDRGHLAGVGLDVLDEEPPSSTHPLVGHERITLTPHIAYLSSVTEAEYVRIQAQNPVTWLQTGMPDTPVTHPQPREEHTP